MTPREMASAMQVALPRRDAAPGRHALEGLMARFPDADKEPRWQTK